jgi:hypothetical protein
MLQHRFLTRLAERKGLKEAGGDKDSAPHGAGRQAVAWDFTFTCLLASIFLV